MEWKLFVGVPPDDVRRVLSIARRRSFSRGEIVFHRGDPADSLHIVVKGRFAVRVTTELGATATLAVHGSDSAFGELALLSRHGVRSATVQALERSETRSIYHVEFARLRAEHPSVNEVLLRLLSEQVRRANERLVEALYVDADTRVRRRLLELAEEYANREGTVVVPLTQEDIAGLAGTSRATANRVLRDEEKRGTLELARGRTMIRDVAGLRRRARMPDAFRAYETP